MSEHRLQRIIIPSNGLLLLLEQHGWRIATLRSVIRAMRANCEVIVFAVVMSSGAYSNQAGEQVALTMPPRKRGLYETIAVCIQVVHVTSLASCRQYHIILDRNRAQHCSRLLSIAGFMVLSADNASYQERLAK